MSKKQVVGRLRVDMLKVRSLKDTQELIAIQTDSFIIEFLSNLLGYHLKFGREESNENKEEK